MKQFKFGVGEIIYHIGPKGDVLPCMVQTVDETGYIVMDLRDGWQNLSHEPLSYVHKYYSKNTELVGLLYE